MEELNLQELSLILDQEIVLVKEEVQKLLSAKQSKYTLGPAQEKETETVLEKSSDANLTDENPPQLRFEGEFQKEILVIFEGSTLDSSLREFLFNILGAAGCSLEDIALVASEHLREFPIGSIEQLRPKICLVFGNFNHPLMHVKTSSYEVITREITYLFADTLEELNKNVPLKRNLWNGIQVLFQIKKP